MAFFFKHLKIISAFLLIVFIIFAGCRKNRDEPLPHPTPENPAPPAEPEPEDPLIPIPPEVCQVQPASDNGSVIAGHYIVTLRNNTTSAQLSVADRMRNMMKTSGISTPLIDHIYNGSVKGFAGKISRDDIEKLRSNPEVENIEEDRIISLITCGEELSVQDIPWGVKRVGYGSGKGKTVWVVDTGVDLTHPDLNVDIARSKSFISKEPQANDENGHGTHVAGIIAAKNNNLGVLGVAYDATVVSVKALNAEGKGSTSTIIAGLQHIEKLGKPGDVINMSIGGSISPTMDEEVLRLAKKGFLFAIAAGNSAVHASNSSPARVEHENVFTTSAMDRNDNWAKFSNYGNGPIVFCAPGVAITSTYKDGKYATVSGTSMAAPHIAGLLLLNGKNIKTDGYVKNDPDGTPDPIGHK